MTDRLLITVSYTDEGSDVVRTEEHRPLGITKKQASAWGRRLIEWYNRCVTTGERRRVFVGADVGAVWTNSPKRQLVKRTPLLTDRMLNRDQ